MGDRAAGVCIWFTGPSGAGKSTVTGALVPRLEELGATVSVLDVVPLLRRRWWEQSSEGKLLRKAYVASQIVYHGGIAIAVTVSARASVREKARRLVGSEHFVEVRIAPPPQVAAARKAARGRRPRPARLVRRAVRGVVRRLSSPRPQEAPARPPDLEIDSSVVPAEEAAAQIIRLLDERGLLPVSERRV